MVTIIGLIFASATCGQAGPPPPPVLPRTSVNSTIGVSAPPVRSPSSAGEFLTGAKFRLELDQATSGSWTNLELRNLLNKLGLERRIAILLDRRIDPSARLSLDIVNQSLIDCLHEIARRSSAEISVTDNVVYIGPPAAARRLRTLIELRSAELSSKSALIKETRRHELSRPQKFSWDDLETPVHLLQQFTERFHLEDSSPAQIPHDLWAAGTLPGQTAAEALSLILIQFDLTFSWHPGGAGVELVSIPELVAIERRQRIKGRTPAELRQRIQERLPDLDTQIDGNDLVIRGTMEEHEVVAALINPTTTKKPAQQAPAPLRQRTFTLQFKRIPVSDVMKKLEESNVVFVYDPAALRQAGVDLGQPIDLELNKATAETFFQALFSPLKLTFEIDHLTVKLIPKK
jgi:hypothetical protein